MWNVVSRHTGPLVEDGIPSLSLWKPFKNTKSLSLFRRSIVSICGGFFGFATNTCRGGCQIGICYSVILPGSTYLEHMESFKLNVLALISKKVHHHLKVGLVRDVTCHHVEVGPIEENLAK